jgi:hypothetical protein
MLLTFVHLVVITLVLTQTVATRMAFHCPIALALVISLALYTVYRPSRIRTSFLTFMLYLNGPDTGVGHPRGPERLTEALGYLQDFKGGATNFLLPGGARGTPLFLDSSHCKLNFSVQPKVLFNILPLCATTQRAHLTSG